VSGQVPFPREKAARDSDDPEVRFPQLVDLPRPLPDTVPAELRELMLSTLEKNPAERPTPGELAGRLEPLVAELPRKLALSRRAARFG
jgi:eukaryotic-like serine/threonine-protein kinase